MAVDPPADAPAPAAAAPAPVDVAGASKDVTAASGRDPHSPPDASAVAAVPAASRERPRAPSWPVAGRGALRLGDRNLLPVTLLTVLFAGICAAQADARAWIWAAAVVLNAAVRAALGAKSASLRLSTIGLDAALWAVFFGLAGPWPPVVTTELAAALAVAMLLSAICAPDRSAGMRGLLVWALPVAALAWQGTGVPLAAFGLIGWMLGLAWLGIPAAPPLTRDGRFAATAVRPLQAQAQPAGSTRRGVVLALQTVAVPMIAVHEGRLFEVNRAAQSLIGRSAGDCVGRRLEELALIEPPDAFQRALAAPDRTVQARLQFAPHLAGGLAWPVRVRVGRSGGGGAIAVIAGEAPPADAGDADWLRHLPGLVWQVDPAGCVVRTSIPDARRWGVRIEPAQRPSWSDAFAFLPSSRAAMETALQEALAGRPTYDLRNERVSASGGRLALRSHVVPLNRPAGAGGPAQRGALVLDTIASAHELIAVDRLRRRKDQYKSLVEASPNLIWACDTDFRFTFVSRRACRDMYGYSVESLLGAPITVLLDPAVDPAQARRALGGLRAGHALRDVEMAQVGRDGRRIVVGVNAVALNSPSGAWVGAIGINVDLTVLKQREARLAEALRVERSVLDSSGQAIAVVSQGMVARCNDALLVLLRRSPSQLAATRLAEVFVEPEDWAEAAAAADESAGSRQAVVREIRLRRIAPEHSVEQTVWCQLTLRAIGNGEYVAALADIDSIRRREAHALHDARHDQLTGLANRRLFAERAVAALATSSLRNAGCALVVIDLDGFKQINDGHGHQAGDAVLQEMAQRLQRVVRPQDTVARHGGDEFALLIPDAGERRDIERIAHRILDEIGRPVTVDGLQGATLSASVGIAFAPEQGRDPGWLLHLADRAMYDAKMAGGNRAVFASISDGDRIERSSVA